MNQRIERYCDPKGSGENLSFGHNDAKGILIQLIVDDGVPSRGHRLNIFNNTFNFMGCNTNMHKQYEHMCCLNYVGRFVEKGG